MIPKYFGSKYLLPSILKECKIVNLLSEQKSIEDVYLFIKEICHNVYRIEDENVDHFIFVDSKLSGYFTVYDPFLEIKNGFSIVGKYADSSPMIIKKIFIRRNSEVMRENYYARYIKFIAYNYEKLKVT